MAKDAGTPKDVATLRLADRPAESCDGHRLGHCAAQPLGGLPVAVSAGDCGRLVGAGARNP
jgi:hypothetical protein